MPDAPLTEALATLDDCDRLVARLHKMCCEPDRSPRMETLAETLASARIEIEELDTAANNADRMLAILKDAGAQLGTLQVECCAPARMPLYAETLQGLTEVQLTVNSALGRAH